MAIPAYYRLLESGSSGPDVALVQTWLNGVRGSCTTYGPLAVDGNFGSSTTTAVRQFQATRGLAMDGKVGQNTWNALYDRYAVVVGPAEIFPGVPMESGENGATVRSVQQRLTANGYGVSADGMFGSATASAVRQFQRAKGLTQDGVVGQTTWNALHGIS